MSATRSLTRGYGSFFKGCAEVAVCPYTFTLSQFYNSKQPKNGDLVLGAAVCIALSTVVPILPTLTSIILTIAAFGAALALASMIVTYPLALLSDAVNACCSSSNSMSYS